MKKDPFFWYALTNANILFYFVIVKNKEISNRLFNNFKDLEESNLGAQGNKKDPTNFEKFVVMVFGNNNGKNSKQIWTKSNHLLLTKYNKKFIEELGVPPDFFKNDLPDKDITTDDLN